ncbi:hypothetical protein FV227_03105 [Methylobacterium sp. WL119]|uniref:hypothetical protein n=2 Tax=Methylobacterium TaxID=407 RepID=UPI0011CA52D7|nr:MULTISPECIES: hypothetical protein [unclassified Methylobacterium]TXN52444.1 hypothetical protein FV227_03105 [Methylobacterium sp. WL119]
MIIPGSCAIDCTRMIERRLYKAALNATQAYAILNGMAGRLDADLVRTFQPVAVAFGSAETNLAHQG